VIADPADATVRARGVRTLLVRRGIEIDIAQVRCGLAGAPLPGREVWGVARTTSARSNRGLTLQSEVAIKRGLPALLFDAVMAHELTHVWFRVHGVRPRDVVEEGVAELTAHWLLGLMPSPHARAMRHRIAVNPDRTYGGGFRKAFGAERRHGWPALAEAVLTTGNLPR
jgi:hypothetical protein